MHFKQILNNANPSMPLVYTFPLTILSGFMLAELATMKISESECDVGMCERSTFLNLEHALTNELDLLAKIELAVFSENIFTNIQTKDMLCI